jgi:hypothetical protein
VLDNDLVFVEPRHIIQYVEAAIGKPQQRIFLFRRKLSLRQRRLGAGDLLQHAGNDSRSEKSGPWPEVEPGEDHEPTLNWIADSMRGRTFNAFSLPFANADHRQGPTDDRDVIKSSPVD